MHQDTNEQKFICDICDEEFIFETSLKSHKDLKHIEYLRPQRCDLCDFKTKDPTLFQKHYAEKHELDRPKRCPHCDMKLMNLNRHIKREHPELTENKKDSKKLLLVCDICVLEFETFKMLQSHISEKHESGGEKICLYCHHTTSAMHNLKFHIESNHPKHAEKKFFCNFCDKGFIFESSF